MFPHGICLESIHQGAITQCGLLDCHDVGICEMWARVGGIGTILINAAERCAARLWCFCGCAECLCQCRGTWRGEACSWTDHSHGLWFICLWGVAWWICMPNAGAWRRFGKCLTRCPCEIGLMDCHDIGKCEMWGRAGGIEFISSNATGRCAAKPYHFCWGPECLCQCTGTWRGQVCS